MLQFQVVQAPMRLGLAEGTEPHQVPFGTLVMAENVCWSKSGLAEKRLGTQALSTAIVGGGGISSAKRLFVRGDELSLTDGTNLYTQTSGGWVNMGAIPNVGLTWMTSHAGILTTKSGDSVVVGTSIVEAWVQGQTGLSVSTDDALVYQVRDLATGTLVTRPTAVALVSPAAQFRILSDGVSWWLVMLDGLNGSVIVFTAGVSTVVASLGAETALRSLDAILVNGDIIIAYTKQAGGIGLLRVNAAAVTVSATGAVTGESSTNVASVSIAVATSLYIGWITSGDSPDLVRYAKADPLTLVQTLAPTGLDSTSSGRIVQDACTMTCVAYDSATCLFVTAYGKTQDSQVTFSAFTIGSTSVNALDCYNICPVTKPFQLASRWYVVAVNVTGYPAVSGLGSATVPASETLLLDITPGSAIDTPGVAGKIESLTGAFWGQGHVSTASVDASGYVRVSTPVAVDVAQTPIAITNAALTGTRLLTITPGGGADMWRSLNVERETYFCTGSLVAYDGVEAVPYGWPYAPGISNTTKTGTGGTLLTGTYIYNVVAERRSAAGILYRSQIGNPTTVAAATNTTKVVLTIATNNAGHAHTMPGGLVVYRTQKNLTVEQRLGIPPRYMTALDVPPVFGLTTLTDVDGDADIRLAVKAALYTEGGELEDFQPTAPQTLAYHQNRIWLVDGSGTTVWFSKDRSSSPSVAPGFHPTQVLTFDRAITALAPLDDKLIVFAKDTLWVVLGDGPAPNGQGGSYQIAPVQTDVGCINPRSVVSTPSGIMFQSTRGIYLLTRALELNWIGRPIREELEQYSRVTSAVLAASRNEIRFTATGSFQTGTEGGLPVFDDRSVVLVFNYVEGQWTTSKYTVGGTYGAVIADACMWQGQWTAVTTGGIVFYETAANSLDTASDASVNWVPLTIETSWINAQGPLSFQSVRNFSFEGVAKTAHSLTIDVGFDSDESTYPQTKTFDVATLGAESYDISIGTRRKCHAIRFRMTDAAPAVLGANTGEGMSIAVLGIEVGMKVGFPKKPPQLTG